jgi:hypothetical protein
MSADEKNSKSIRCACLFHKNRGDSPCRRIDNTHVERLCHYQIWGKSHSSTRPALCVENIFQHITPRSTVGFQRELYYAVNLYIHTRVNILRHLHACHLGYRCHAENEPSRYWGSIYCIDTQTWENTHLHKPEDSIAALFAGCDSGKNHAHGRRICI